MAVIRPFNAVRPTRDKVSLIASRSYQSYTPAEREARLDHNPYSFLHIVNPGYKYQKVINGEERFELVRNRYQEFKEDGIFIKDKVPSLYIYKIISRVYGNYWCFQRRRLPKQYYKEARRYYRVSRNLV